MKFKSTSYHFNLLKDFDRVAVFNEAILDYVNSLDENSKKGIAFDLGCGSGVLSYIAKDYFDKIISIDIDNKIANCARENLKDFENIEVFSQDVIGFDFKDKANLIICEMLDTALIDEEEIPVLKYAKNFLKEDGKIIPQGIINSVELIYMEPHYIQYEDNNSNPNYVVLSNPVIYSEFNFLDDIDENFTKEIKFNIISNKKEISFSDNVNSINLNYFNNENNKYKVNGIKLTSFTKLNNNLIVGPTPMLNPVILVPFSEVELKDSDTLTIKLSYIMGKGIETINIEVL